MLESITFLSKDILSIISKYLECPKPISKGEILFVFVLILLMNKLSYL